MDRFLNKVVVGTDEECWNWIGARTSSGYGSIGDYYQLKSAHRVSWELYRDPIPNGKLVLHKCDNKLCVNPNHLYLGTSGDNMNDRAIRNENGQGGIQSKFYIGEIWLMKKLYNSGKVFQRDIAMIFKCSQGTISFLVNDKSGATAK